MQENIRAVCRSCPFLRKTGIAPRVGLADVEYISSPSDLPRVTVIAADSVKYWSVL